MESSFSSLPNAGVNCRSIRNINEMDTGSKFGNSYRKPLFALGRRIWAQLQERSSRSGADRSRIALGHSVDGIYWVMPWDIEVTDEFKAWWTGLTEGEQNEITAAVELPEEQGTGLQFPHSSNIRESRHSHMRELRKQCAD